MDDNVPSFDECLFICDPLELAVFDHKYFHLSSLSVGFMNRWSLPVATLDSVRLSGRATVVRKPVTRVCRSCVQPWHAHSWP